MPAPFTIPLYQPPALRPFTATYTLDARISACFIQDIVNSEKRSKTSCVVKRTGMGAVTTVNAGQVGMGVHFSNNSAWNAMSAFGSTTSTIYIQNGSSLGAMNTNDHALHFSEGLLGSNTFVFVTGASGANATSGYFLASNALSSFVGDTHTSTTIDNIASTANLYVGQLLSGHADIAAGTRIATIASATSITTTLATVGSHSGITITSSILAKILDPNFPSSIVGQFVEMDGYVFIMNNNGRIYQSNINDPTTWQAQNYLTANLKSDPGVGLARYKDMVVGFGSDSIEFYKNTGNPTGSVLSRVGGISGYGAYGFSGVKSMIASGFDSVYFFHPASSNLCSLNGLSVDILSKWPNIFPIGFTGSLDVVSYMGLRVINCAIGSSNAALQRWYLPDYDDWVHPNFTNITYLSSASDGNSHVLNAVDSGTSGILFNIIQTGINSPVWTDNGSAYTMTIQTEPYYLNDGLPFVIDNITLIADTQSSGSSTLSSTADDYATFQTVGSFDLTQQQKNLSGGGYYDSSVAFKLTDAGNNAWRGQALKITWRPYQ